MIRHIAVVACLILSQIALAQLTTKQIDSLKTVLPGLKQNTVRVRVLNQLARSCTYEQGELLMKYAGEALELSKKLKFTEGIIASYKNLAAGSQSLNNYDQEFAYLTKALDETTKLKDDAAIAEVYTLMALNKYTSNYDESLAYFKKAIKKAEDSENMRVLNDALLQLGAMYQLKGNLYEAAECFQRIIINGEKAKDTKSVITGSTYLAGIYKAQGNIDRALQYQLKAIRLMEEAKGHNSFTSVVMMDVGKIYFGKEDYKKAYYYYNKSYQYLTKTSNTYAQLINLIYLSNTHAKLKDYKLAREVLDKAVAMSFSMKPSLAKIQVLQQLGEASYNSGNYNTALKHHAEALSISKDLALPEETAIQYGNVGATYLQLAKQAGSPGANKATGESIAHLLESVKRLKQLKNLNGLQQFSKYLADAYEYSGKPEMALPAFKASILYNDSIYDKQKRDEFTVKQSEYEFGKREAILKEKQGAAIAHEQLLRNFSYAGIAILVVVSGGAGYGYRRKKRDNIIIAREKQRSDDLLLNILPHEVAEELKEKGEASAHYYEHVSILFTDFEGFTKHSENMSPQELIAELNYCFKGFDQIISKYNIEKIKTIGDAYMAVSGLPSASPDHALNVVRAALEIRDFIVNYKEQRREQGKIFFEMRIGINSGEVVAGIVGIKKFAYDIWGDAVNIAARMETNGQVGRVNISEATYELVKDNFETEYRGEIEAKGKGEIKMYFVEPKKTSSGI